MTKAHKGTIVHRLIELFYEGLDLSSNEALEEARTAARVILNEYHGDPPEGIASDYAVPNDWEEIITRELWPSVQGFDDFLTTEGTDLFVRRHEHEVLLKSTNMGIQGRIDHVFEEADTGETIIRDYKTGTQFLPLARNDHQLMMYALLYKELRDVTPSRGEHLTVKINKRTPAAKPPFFKYEWFPLTKHKMRMAYEFVSRAVDDMNNLRDRVSNQLIVTHIPYNPQARTCSWYCDHQVSCETMDEDADYYEEVTAIMKGVINGS